MKCDQQIKGQILKENGFIITLKQPTANGSSARGGDAYIPILTLCYIVDCLALDREPQLL